MALTVPAPTECSTTNINSAKELKEAGSIFYGTGLICSMRPVDILPNLWVILRFGILCNTTEGVNAVVRSLDFKVGEQIIVTNHGYNACRNIVEYIASKTGAEVVVVELPFVGITETK